MFPGVNNKNIVAIRQQQCIHDTNLAQKHTHVSTIMRFWYEYEIDYGNYISRIIISTLGTKIVILRNVDYQCLELVFEVCESFASD